MTTDPLVDAVAERFSMDTDQAEAVVRYVRSTYVCMKGHVNLPGTSTPGSWRCLECYRNSRKERTKRYEERHPERVRERKRRWEARRKAERGRS